MPPGGENLRSHLAQKYGTTLEGSIAARQRLTGLGESLRFTFNYFDDMRMYNTRKAHKLLHWAKDQKVNGESVQTALKMAMFSSFFTDKGVMDDEENILSIAESVGLEKTQAKKVLDDHEIEIEVEQSQNYWRRQGIQAVPAFIFNERYLVSGAQDANFFKEMLV